MQSVSCGCAEINSRRLDELAVTKPQTVRKARLRWPLEEGNHYYEPCYPEEIYCQECGSLMVYRDTRVCSLYHLNDDGNVVHDVFFLQRYQCQNCREKKAETGNPYLHIIYPREISSQFRYDLDTVESVIDTYRASQENGGEAISDTAEAPDPGKEAPDSEPERAPGIRRTAPALLGWMEKLKRLSDTAEGADPEGFLDPKTVRRWTCFYEDNRDPLLQALMKSTRADRLRKRYPGRSEARIRNLLMAEPGWFGTALFFMTARQPA